jgi:hypothetical protein
MKNVWKWFLGIALVLVLFFGPYLFRLLFPALGYGAGYGMMGGRYGGYGMMGGYGFFPFGGLMWLIPLGTLALAVLGIVWLVNNLNGSKNVQAPPSVCVSCGKAAQADWKTCPYCGNTL